MDKIALSRYMEDMSFSNACYILCTAVAGDSKDFEATRRTIDELKFRSMFDVKPYNDAMGVPKPINCSISQSGPESGSSLLNHHCYCCRNTSLYDHNFTGGYVFQKHIRATSKTSTMPIPSLIKLVEASAQYNAYRGHSQYLFEASKLTDFFSLKYLGESPYTIERLSGLIVVIMSFAPKQWDNNSRYLNQLWRPNEEDFMQYLDNSLIRFEKHMSASEKHRWLHRDILFGTIRKKKMNVHPLSNIFYEVNPLYSEVDKEQLQKQFSDKEGNFMLQFTPSVSSPTRATDNAFVERKNDKVSIDDVYRYASHIAKSLTNLVAAKRKQLEHPNNEQQSERPKIEDFFKNDQVQFRKEVFDAIWRAVIDDNGENFKIEGFEYKFECKDDNTIRSTIDLFQTAAKRFAFTFQTRCMALHEIGKEHGTKDNNCVSCGKIPKQSAYNYYEIVDRFIQLKQKGNKKEYESKKKEREKSHDYSDRVCGDCCYHYLAPNDRQDINPVWIDHNQQVETSSLLNT